MRHMNPRDHDDDCAAHVCCCCEASSATARLQILRKAANDFCNNFQLKKYRLEFERILAEDNEREENQ